MLPSCLLFYDLSISFLDLGFPQGSAMLQNESQLVGFPKNAFLPLRQELL